MRIAISRYRAAAQLRWDAAQQLITLGDTMRVLGGNPTQSEWVGYRSAETAYEQASRLLARRKLELSYQEVLAEPKIS